MKVLMNPRGELFIAVSSKILRRGHYFIVSGNVCMNVHTFKFLLGYGWKDLGEL